MNLCQKTLSDPVYAGSILTANFDSLRSDKANKGCSEFSVENIYKYRQ